jgi:hypothetical protein
MVANPPVVLVLDVNVLSVTTPSEWREFSRIGSCFLPQAVFAEISQAFARSPDSDLVKISKSFNHFFPISGWQLTDATSPHLAFKSPEQTNSPRVRLALATGRCVHAISELYPKSLVILVSKDRGLLQRLYQIPGVNLCGITSENLLQWSRNGQRPVAVSQKLQQFRAAHGIKPPLEGKPAPPEAQVQPSPMTEPVESASRKLPVWFWAGTGLAIATSLVWLWSKYTTPRPHPKQTNQSAPEEVIKPTETIKL